MKPTMQDDLPRLSARLSPLPAARDAEHPSPAGEIVRRFFQLLGHLEAAPPAAPEIKARITRLDGQG